MTSRPQDDELLSQDTFSLCSSTAHSYDASDKPWTINDVDSLDSNSIASSKPDSPVVQMLPFSMSHHAMLHSTVGASDIMYSAGSDFPGLTDVGDQTEMDFKTQDFNTYNSLFDFAAFDNDVNGQNGTQTSCTPEQRSPVDTWNPIAPDNRYSQNSMDHFNGNVLQQQPVSPPLTEASHDFSVTSSCSHSGYPAFITHEDAMLKDITATPVGTQGSNLGDPLFPLTPPLNEQDPNRLVELAFLFQLF